MLATASAGAVTLGPVTTPTLPPLEVAPGPVTVGPVTIDANASVTSDGTQVGVETSGLPVADGGPDLGLTVGTDGAQVGVGGVDAGVGLSPGALAPSGGDAAASTPVAAAPGSSSGPAGKSANLDPAPAPTRSPSTAHPKVVPFSNGSPAAITGGVDAPGKRSWWSLATGAARLSFLWIVLLLAALVIRNRVGAAVRDQRGVSAARSA